MIVEHLIAREYREDIEPELAFADQVIELAVQFRQRLTSLVANWLRVGYCQGNFNSDNCAAGGYTLDYGPFGFCEIFDPEFQPWTGGGRHFSFFNQPAAAEANFHMFWKSLRVLLEDDEHALGRLDQIRQGFAEEMSARISDMWTEKLGLSDNDPELVKQLLPLMARSEVDYTLFFRELSHIPEGLSALKKTFYVPTSADTDEQWQTWLAQWRARVDASGDLAEVSARMKRTNPKYTWREWLVVPAYEQAMQGNYSLVKELQSVLSHPYDEQSEAVAKKFCRLKPKEFFNAGGVSHYSCSS